VGGADLNPDVQRLIASGAATPNGTWHESSKR
jgi:hypothetical protein